jgi:hypothetical protein
MQEQLPRATQDAKAEAGIQFLIKRGFAAPVVIPAEAGIHLVSSSFR